MSQSDRLDPDEGLLDQDEEALLRRVERSQVWRLIRDGMCLDREQLFAGNSSISGLSGQPSTNEALWMNRGAILYVQHLLQEGPRFVIWYRRYMAEQQEKRAVTKATPKTAEREFAAKPEFNDKPDFNL